MNRSVDTDGEMPYRPSTRTSTVPGTRAGAVTVNQVVDVTTRSVPGGDPNNTLDTPRNREPVTVTRVPPPVDPLDGVTL